MNKLLSDIFAEGADPVPVILSSDTANLYLPRVPDPFCRIDWHCEDTGIVVSHPSRRLRDALHVLADSNAPLPQPMPTAPASGLELLRLAAGIAWQPVPEYVRTVVVPALTTEGADTAFTEAFVEAAAFSCARFVPDISDFDCEHINAVVSESVPLTPQESCQVRTVRDEPSFFNFCLSVRVFLGAVYLRVQRDGSYLVTYSGYEKPVKEPEHFESEADDELSSASRLARLYAEGRYAEAKELYERFPNDFSVEDGDDENSEDDRDDGGLT